MVDISEAAKKLACELANNEGSGYYNPVNLPGTQFGMALARILQEHSDVAKTALATLSHHDNCTSPFGYPERCSCGLGAVTKPLQSLILPDEPDALEEIFTEMLNEGEYHSAKGWGSKLTDRLSKRGLAIVPTTKRADPIIDEAGIGCGAGSVG